MSDTTQKTPPGGGHDEPRRMSIKSQIHVFFVTISCLAGCMFLYKLFAFMQTVQKDELAGFANDPIVIYGFVAGGFLLLLAWSYLSGQLSNVEEIKHEMLTRFAEQERAENELAARAKEVQA